MAELKLPDLGENIEEAEVLKVLVSEGDGIEKDQNVLELETDKAAFELPSTLTGTVRKVHVSEGDRVRLGQTILTVDEGEAAEGKKGKRGKVGQKPAEQKARSGKGGERDEGEPPPGEEETRPGTDERGGDEAAEDQAGVREAEDEEEDERAVETEEAPRGGDAKDGDDDEEEPEDREDEEEEERQRGERNEAEARQHERGRDRGERKGQAEKHEKGERERRTEKAERREPEETPKKKEQPPRNHDVVAGPATRRLARELGVDLARVEGRAAGGRVTADDVKAAARGRRPSKGEEEQAPLPDFERFGPVERRRLSGIERAAVPHLASSWRTIPHVTQHDVADVTELERMRRRFEEKRRPSDPKLAPTALVVKAVVAALKAFPRVNASLDVEREELVLKRYYHIGVAVDTEYGLVVPVVRDADRKTTRQIAAEVAGLAERARERKLTRDEMQGASFTVTNLGGIGGTSFTPIVSHPEVAILGVSRVREEPVVRDGEVAVRLVMPLSLSYDHRAINGADAARFARHLAELLEDPLRLLMES